MSKINNYNYIPACPKVASNSQYILLNRQQPIHTRISTNNERDRRPIDPPPIIQIKLSNTTPQKTDIFHQNPFFFMCANLAHATNDNEIYTPTHNALSGQTVASMYKLKDIYNQDGAFFIFGDLSVKVEGIYRLKLSLFEITSTGSVCLQSVFTSPFIVYSTKKFPGMLDSTFLSRSFSYQGVRIKIRKENRANTTNVSINQRKRKLETITQNDCTTQHSSNDPSNHDEERRSSMLSSGTESCNSSETHSPMTTNITCSSHVPRHDFILPFASKPLDLPIELPPIHKPSLIEQDAIFGMIKLSSTHHTPTRKKLCIQDIL